MELTDAIPEEELAAKAAAEPAEEDSEDFMPERRIRPEPIFALLAVLAALVLLLTVVVCLPYMGREEPAAAVASTESGSVLDELAARAEDPENLLHRDGSEETLPSVEPIIHPEFNPYGPLDFQYDRNNYLYCLRQESYPGVDVSAFQGNIDWQKVKDSGIRFAMLRLGYRGYESGRLVEDEYIQKNLKATREVGMPIGAYFFSQALTIKEVDEEIDFMLKVLGDYDLHMPIVLDWEIPTSDARTARMDARTLTALQEYFCQTMVEKGFTPMIYFNWHQSNTLLYLNELEDYPFWLALYTERMTYPYKVEMWQYTSSGRVPGIQGDVDINVYMPEE
ncbi:MAG: glycoside hydrolase family 25 protein [Oscillospiraceae bacterium]|nr:glycoside hydrolase family 25 protein [Oscillospiraceae bacterium]